MHATKAVSGHYVPILVCVAASAGAAVRMLGPESMDGQGDFSARVGAEDVRTGLPIEDIGKKVDISVSYLWMD